jgi:hypothetical protein
MGRDAKIDWKALSKRIGHSDVAFTMKQYVQTDLEADRQVANTLECLPARDYRSFSSSIFPYRQSTSSYLKPVSAYRHETRRLVQSND